MSTCSQKRLHRYGLSSDLSGKTSTGSGDYAMVVWDWDDSFTFTWSSGTDALSQSGAAVVEEGYSDSPLAYYMAAADVENTSMRGYGNGNYETGRTPWYPFHEVFVAASDGSENVSVGAQGGEMRGFDDNLDMGTSFSYQNFVAQVSGDASTIRLFGNVADVGYTYQNANGYNAWGVEGDYAWLGAERFPYVIAATSEIKEKLEADKNSGGMYSTGLRLYSSNGYFTTVRYDYSVIVNPSGCGDWMEGSVESVLESVWISEQYWGNADAASEIRNFYETFYRCDSDGSILSDILDGK